MLIYMFITDTLTAIQYWSEYDKSNCFNFNIYYHKCIMILTLAAVKLSTKDHIEILAMKNC